MKQEAVPSRDSATATQVSVLLAVVNQLQPYLLLPHPDVDDPATRNPPKLDGEALLAATATFIKTCDALDKIVSDPTRFSLDKQTDLYDSIVSLNREQQKFVQAQTEAAHSLKRPSYQLRPTLASVEGSYLAFWGDITAEGGAIIGRGETPEKALADFDAAFQRTPVEQVRVIFETTKKPIRKQKSK